MIREDRDRVLHELIDKRKKKNIRKYCPEFKPEYGTYEIKTRPPHYTNNWRLNYLRRAREEELKDEAMLAARLKCFEEANAFTQCSLENPRNESAACVEIFKPMQ
jgi:hypothetical protein